MKIVDKLKQHEILVVCIVFLVLFLAALLWFYKPCCWFNQDSTFAGNSNIKEVTAQNGTVQIPMSEINDGTMQYYKYNVDGVWVRFFTIRASDGSIRTAFDACLVCGDDGYYNNGNVVVCKKCRMNIDIDDVGIISGGCNPIPLEYQTTSLEVIIEVSELENGRQYFE